MESGEWREEGAMFAHGYFGEGFFAGRYFPPVRLRGAATMVVAITLRVPEPIPLWLNAA